MNIRKSHFFSGIFGVTLAKVINVQIFDPEWMNSFLVELPIVIALYFVIWLPFLKFMESRGVW